MREQQQDNFESITVNFECGDGFKAQLHSMLDRHETIRVDSVQASPGRGSITLTPHAADTVNAELLAALKGLLQFGDMPGENAIERSERVAEQFHKETGFLAPGKDQGLQTHPTREERGAAWDSWVEGLYDAARAAIAKAEAQQ